MEVTTIINKKMKEFADITANMIKTYVEDTETRGTELEKKEKELDRKLQELKKFEEAVNSFREYQEYEKEIYSFGGVKSTEELVTKLPMDKKTFQKVCAAISEKVNNFIEDNSGWESLRRTFTAQITRALYQKYGTNIFRIPAVEYYEVKDIIDNFNFLKGRTALSLFLLNYRAKNGFSQSEAAKSLGISISQYSNWESGRANPSAQNIKSLAETLKKESQNIETLMASAKFEPKAPDPESLNLAEKLRYTRIKRNLSFREAAKEVCTSLSMYFNWEKGLVPVDEDNPHIHDFIATVKPLCKDNKNLTKYEPIRPIYPKPEPESTQDGIQKDDKKNIPSNTVTTLPENLPEILKTIRAKKGYSLSFFAQKIGVPKGTLHGWEKGITPRGNNQELLLGVIQQETGNSVSFQA